MKAEFVPFASEHWTALRGRLHADHTARMAAVAPMDDVFWTAMALSVLVRTVILDGRPEFIMGCGLQPGIGYPWLMKTDVAMAKFWQVIRASRPFIFECLQHRPLLRAEIPPDDKLVARWLRWLRFQCVGDGAGGSARWELEAPHGN